VIRLLPDPLTEVVCVHDLPLSERSVMARATWLLRTGLLCTFRALSYGADAEVSGIRS
jgi:hypothetical protein